jgi:hypothetical protein
MDDARIASEDSPVARRRTSGMWDRLDSGRRADAERGCEGARVRGCEGAERRRRDVAAGGRLSTMPRRPPPPASPASGRGENCSRGSTGGLQCRGGPPTPALPRKRWEGAFSTVSRPSVRTKSCGEPTSPGTGEDRPRQAVRRGRGTAEASPRQESREIHAPAPPHLRTSAPPHPRTPAPPHLRTFAPSHLRTFAPPHLRTFAPSHSRTSPKRPRGEGTISPAPLSCVHQPAEADQCLPWPSG